MLEHCQSDFVFTAVLLSLLKDICTPHFWKWAMNLKVLFHKELLFQVQHIARAMYLNIRGISCAAAEYISDLFVICHFFTVSVSKWCHERNHLQNM
jgi:hypothetical protein